MIRYIYNGDEKVALRDLRIAIGYSAAPQPLDAAAQANLDRARQRLSSLPGAEVLALALKMHAGCLSPEKPTNQPS